MNVYDVIRRPVVTEKAVRGQALGKYVFEVDRKANKPLIRLALKQLFGVHATEIRTTLVHGKTRRAARARGRVSRTSDWKKAIVTLAKGEKIELTEGA